MNRSARAIRSATRLADGAAVGVAVTAMLLALSACGGGNTKPAAEPEGAAEGAAESDADKTSDLTGEPPESAAASADPTTPAEPSGDAPEPPCKFDTSKPIEGTMGSIRIAGCISPDGVADSVKYKWRSVFECYQDARKADPKAKGTVEIRIGIGKKGVRSVQVPRSEIPSDEFIQCVIDTLRDASMPKPEADTAMVIWTAKF